LFRRWVAIFCLPSLSLFVSIVGMQNFGGPLLHVAAREVLRSGHFPARWRSCVAVSRFPVDARTSPQPSLTRSTRCTGVPSGL
jgi:hypothetical protein